MKYIKNTINNNKKIIIIYLLLGIFLSVLDMFNVKFFQVILDDFSIGNLSLRMIIIYGILLIIYTVLSYYDNYPSVYLQNKLYLDFKLSALRKLSKIDYSKYQKIGLGKLTQKVENGAVAARDVIYEYYFRIFRELLPTMISSLIFIFLIDYKIAIIVLLGYILVFIITKIILLKLYELKEKIVENEENMNKYLVRGFQELISFRINKKYKKEIEKCHNNVNEIVNSKVKISLVHEAFFTLFALLVAIIKIAVLIYALLFNKLSVGSIVALITLLGKAYEPIAIFNVIYVDYKLDKVAMNRYVEFLDLEDDKQLTNGKKITIKNKKIILKLIKYKYNKNITLNGINMEINPNDKIAIVGKSGSGKSTILKLITGFLKPIAGEIYIGKEKLSNINLDKFYDYVSYVSQESPLFDGTLRENIIFDQKVEDKDIIKVLKLLNLTEFYNKLEKGLDSEVGEKGILMSGGERQRIALARLFFDNSSIVILDEATSALDSENEINIINLLLNKLKNKTIILVTHKVDLLKQFDYIYVIKDGVVIEKGKYIDLNKNNTYFYEISKQLKEVS
ncbi:MAG: ABC transporter ATP-binding protein [Bacilli bacterium]|nr:ABC transporter ATP-binding protein [Bacilli bacterium]